MANENYQRSSGKGKAAYLGIDLKRPVDLMPQGRAPFLLNVSPDLAQGSLAARAGLTSVARIGPALVSPPAIHSAQRVNNNVPGATMPAQRFIGAGSNLYAMQAPGSGVDPYPQIDSGYSGNPLSMVPYRPPQSPESWLYCYDSAKQQKYRTDGAKYNIGILPPTQAPTTALSQPFIKAVLDPTSATGWVASGAAAAPTLVSRVPAGMTISSIVYDSGTTGWATVAPAIAGNNFASLGLGARLTLGGELATITELHGPLPSIQAAGVAYDDIVLNAGLATVSPNVQFQGLERNRLVVIGGNATRILSVTQGPDGSYSFRCVLPSGVGTGAGLVIPTSFRVYTATTHAAGETISGSALQTVMTATAGIGSSVGTVSLPNATFGTPDLSQVSSRAITDQDYMHVSLNVDNPANVQEIRVLVDVDNSVNDFTRNYYYYVVRQSDFQLSTSGSTTAVTSQLTALQNDIANSYATNEDPETEAAQLPYPGATDGQEALAPSVDQLRTGNNQWFEAILKIGSLVRVGNDETTGLFSVKSIAVTAILSGNATIQFGGWWVGGAFGPDANFNSYGNQGQPVLYRYRYRSSLSGAYSDPSPATRSGEIPMRQAVLVSVTASPDPQVDLIDIERNGGTFNTWHRVVVFPNQTATYLDTVTETVAAGGDPLELTSYAPWPVTDKIRRGTCNVVGTRLRWVSGDTFNLNWIRGVEVIINQQTYTLHAPPDSTTTLNLAESAGNQSGVQFIIPEATIIGFPLPYACLGPDGRIFATGDPYNPGFLYFTNPYNPDTSSDQGYIEVSSPSEPLGPPVYYEGAVYVFSNTSVYRVDSTPGQINPYAAYKLGGVFGLAAPWAYTAKGPLLAWLSYDGIYSYGASGGAGNLTSDDLYPLFPFESRPGLPVSVAGYALYPPDFNETRKLRLSFADNFLYFDYQDTQGNQRTLAYNVQSKGWIPYQYAPGIALHYQEEGVANPLTLALGVDGTINYLSALTSDNYTPFTAVVVTPADDQGETRSRKQYSEIMIDYAGLPKATVYYDNFLVPGIAPTLPQWTSRWQTVVDLAMGATSVHRNIGLVFTWASDSGTRLYEWQPSYLAQPEDTQLRPTDWTDAGTLHYKFVHGCRIHADTGGAARGVQIQYDGGIVGPFLTVNHNGELILPYTFPPFKARLMRLVPLDANSWRLYKVEWEVDPEPEPVNYWVTQPTSFGMSGYAHLRDIQFAYASVNAGAVLAVIVDGVSHTVIDSLPATGGQEVKRYFPTPPLKGKIWQLYGTGTALQVYGADCEFRVKSWGQTSYGVIKPFGDASSGEARI